MTERVHARSSTRLSLPSPLSLRLLRLHFIPTDKRERLRLSYRRIFRLSTAMSATVLSSFSFRFDDFVTRVSHFPFPCLQPSNQPSIPPRAPPTHSKPNHTQLAPLPHTHPHTATKTTLIVSDHFLPHVILERLSRSDFSLSRSCLISTLLLARS